MTAPHFRVVITDFLDESTIESEVLDGLARVETLQAHGELDLMGTIDDASALIIYHDIPRLTDAALSSADRCVGIVRAGVGFNNIDFRAAAARGIVVCNVPDYGTEDVADHALMLLLALARRLLACDAAIREGGWDYSLAHSAPRMRGKTLGIVGCGRIGTAMALRGKALGLDVVFHDPFVAPGLEKALGIRRTETLDELLGTSDFVSLHCYLDETTFHLIDARALALIKPGALLINTARGPVVDQEALIDALDSGRLAGAGLDVVEREPLDDERLRNHPSVILTPHCAFYTREGFLEMRRKAAQEVRRLLLGHEPRCPVNLDLIEIRRQPC
jgi:phosphoglycerate dehydrogenase-like enzyme